MALRTRKPTGKTPPPVILVEGDEGAGKSWAAAEFTVSAKVGRSVWLQVGEVTADEYGQIPGVRYEIIEHDGSWQEIYGAVVEAKAEAAAAQSAGEKPYVLVIDQMGAVWELLSEWAYNRARGSKSNKQKLAEDPNAEIDVTPNYWNDANDRWRKLMTQLLTFPGIVVLLARGRETALIEHGKPVLGRKDYRVEGQKSMAFDVPVWVRMTRGGNPILVKLRAVHNGLQPSARPRSLPGFTLEELVFKTLGYDPAASGDRGYVPLVAGADAPDSPRFMAFLAAVESAPDEAALLRQWQHVKPAVEAGEITSAEGERVRAAMAARKDELNTGTPSPAVAEKVTDKQNRRMHALWRQIGLGGQEHREERLTRTSLIVGRDVDSSAHLTDLEADKVIATLDAEAKEGTP